MKLLAAVAVPILLVLVVILGTAHAVVAALFGGGSSPNAEALADIPPNYLALYKAAATVCPGLDWSMLAAIGKVETDHGRSTLPGVTRGTNSAGAKGPMQFLQPTFDMVTRRHPLPTGSSSPPSPYNPYDAIHAAAYYLCDSGADQGDIGKAIFAYNHAQWYVEKVLAQAKKYRSPGVGEDVAGPAAARAIAYAQGQLGLPYVWGGDGPDAGERGFDCSGLTKAAYEAAGIALPRTAHAQYHAGPRITADQLAPGDLVFYGNPSTKITHVGIYIGDGRMIHAPSFGKPVQVGNYRWRNDSFVGATRP